MCTKKVSGLCLGRFGTAGAGDLYRDFPFQQKNFGETVSLSSNEVPRSEEASSPANHAAPSEFRPTTLAACMNSL